MTDVATVLVRKRQLSLRHLQRVDTRKFISSSRYMTQSMPIQVAHQYACRSCMNKALNYLSLSLHLTTRSRSLQ